MSLSQNPPVILKFFCRLSSNYNLNSSTSTESSTHHRHGRQERISIIAPTSQSRIRTRRHRNDSDIADGHLDLEPRQARLSQDRSISCGPGPGLTSHLNRTEVKPRTWNSALLVPCWSPLEYEYYYQPASSIRRASSRPHLYCSFYGSPRRQILFSNPSSKSPRISLSHSSVSLPAQSRRIDIARALATPADYNDTT